MSKLIIKNKNIELPTLYRNDTIKLGKKVNSISDIYEYYYINNGYYNMKDIEKVPIFHIELPPISFNNNNNTKGNIINYDYKHINENKHNIINHFKYYISNGWEIHDLNHSFFDTHDLKTFLDISFK